ncbi:hypothetical protein AB7C87_18420 [Natrarchaeobius sp. A-rgal3]
MNRHKSPIHDGLFGRPARLGVRALEELVVDVEVDAVEEVRNARERL